MRNVNLGELLDLFTNIKVGTKEAIQNDILGRIYEYFLGQFAKKELQKGGEFYTPACLVRTMVECIEPFEGKVYDPACGSGGMFIQSMKFVLRSMPVSINPANGTSKEHHTHSWHPSTAASH